MSNANRGVNFGPPRFKIAVHAIIWIANSGGILSSAMLADLVDTHATFMRRVMQSLSIAGIIESKGGREGGYILRKTTELISLGEVYSAVSSGQSNQELNVDCGLAGRQLDIEIEKILLEAEQQAINHLSHYSIAEVMNRVDFFKNSFSNDLIT